MKTLTNLRHAQQIEVDHIGEVGAGSTVELFGYKRKSLIMRPQWVNNLHEVITAEVCGDSLLDEDIRSGDKLVCKVIFDKSEVRPGKLVVIKLPTGRSIVKRIYFREDKIILRSSNPAYEDMVYDRAEIQIEALVKELVRKLD